MILISDNVIAVFSVHYNVFIVAVNVFLRVLLYRCIWKHQYVVEQQTYRDMMEGNHKTDVTQILLWISHKSL